MQTDRDRPIDFETLAKHMPSVVFHVRVYSDGTFHVPFICREASDILGLDPRVIEENPQTLLDLVVAEDKDEILSLLSKACEAGEKATCELRIKQPEGRTRWIRLEAKPERITGGNGFDWFGNAMDVTESRTREAELQKKTALLDGILNSVEDVIFVVRQPDRRIVIASASVESVFGYKPSEVKGRSAEMLHESRESFEEFGRSTERVLETGRCYRGGHRMRRRDGGVFPTEHVITPLHPEAGWQDGVVSVVRDISEQKTAEGNLAKSEKKYRSLLEHANESVIVVLDHVIAYANPQTAVLVDASLEEVIGQPYRHFLHPDDVAFVESLIERLLTGRRIQRDFEFRVKNSKEETRWVRGNAVSLKWEGRPAVMTLLTDISVQKQMQHINMEMMQRLQQAQKMEAIGSLAGGIAHDFNNVLFPIVGLAEMLMEELPEGGRHHDHAVDIFSAGKRGSELVKQILAFSRQSEAQKLPVRLQQILKEVIKLGRSTIPSDIEIRQDIQSDCRSVMADPTQIHQIAMNLLTNAYHAIEPEHGRIAIELKETRIDKKPWPGSRLDPGAYAVLRVADTGCGIDPDILDRIFEPYFTTKAQGKGTGLGLAVVDGIVKEHGGDIRVTSDLGQGTTFQVYLPLLGRRSESKTVSRQGTHKGGTEHILLVDDERAIVRMETHMLESLGYRLSSYLSSVDALAAFITEPQEFDLVLTDMSMPRMTGDQLAKEMLAVRPDIPIILCTGFSERIDRERAESAGIKGFLMKPVIKADLAGTVRRVLDENSGTSSPGY